MGWKSQILKQYMVQLNNVKSAVMYDLKPVKLGCEVRGVNLHTENREEVIRQIKEDVLKHRILIFKDQGIISGERHVEISHWFGELESTFYKHPQSPHPDVFRVSNDELEGCTGVGRTGWHIDGSFQPCPFAYSLYHIVSVPKDGATVFAPMTELIEQLPKKKFDEWNRLWMVSDRRTGPIHPLVYRHPVTKLPVMCFHLGMTSDFMYDYGTENEKIADNNAFRRIIQDIYEEFVKDNLSIQYKHKWSEGDFIISDNLAVAHEASPETQLPRSQVGLRILHRTTVKGTTAPSK